MNHCTRELIMEEVGDNGGFYGVKLDQTLANWVLSDGNLKSMLKYGDKWVLWGGIICKVPLGLEQMLAPFEASQCSLRNKEIKGKWLRIFSLPTLFSGGANAQVWR